MLHLQVVEDLLPPGKAKEKLEQTLELADQAIAEGRDAVSDLRSSATTTNDLAQALRTACDELATPDTAAFQVTVEGPARGSCIRSFATSFTASLAKPCEMLSPTPGRSILKRTSSTQNVCSACEFGMTGRALNQQRWKRAGPAIMACQECANALDKSARSSRSGAALGRALRST